MEVMAGAVWLQHAAAATTPGGPAAAHAPTAIAGPAEAAHPALLRLQQGACAVFVFCVLMYVSVFIRLCFLNK